MSLKSFFGQMGFGDEKPEKTSSQLIPKDDWKEKRRSDRIDLGQGKELAVHLLKPDPAATLSGSTIVASVVNVSLRGCRLFFNKPDDTRDLKVGDVLVASLLVDDFSIPLQVEVVRAGEKAHLAVRFKPPFPKELERLERFLEPRCLGLSLREIDPASLQRSDHKNLRWFQGINETDLFSWYDPSTREIIQQQLVFLNKVVEWRGAGPLQTGRIHEDPTATLSKLEWVKSDLLDIDAIHDSNVLDQAGALLDSAKIDENVKTVFLDRIRGQLKKNPSP